MKESASPISNGWQYCHHLGDRVINLKVNVSPISELKKLPSPLPKSLFLRIRRHWKKKYRVILAIKTRYYNCFHSQCLPKDKLLPTDEQRKWSSASEVVTFSLHVPSNCLFGTSYALSIGK